MNKQETAEAIKVMQAYVDGDKIEARSDEGEWTHLLSAPPSWDWAGQEYRIKPKPREWMVYIGESGKLVSCGLLHSKSNKRADPDPTMFRVREMTDEVL